MRRGFLADHQMHAGEAEIDGPLVRALIHHQFPALRDLSLCRIPSTGTVNVIFRLGEDLAVRLPRLAEGVQDLLKEWEWLPKLAPVVPLQIPEPVFLGEPALGYPYPWAVYRWLEGEVFDRDRVHDQTEAAQTLGEFVHALRRIDPAGGPVSGRDPLAELDTVTREAIDAMPANVDRVAMRAAWERSLKAPIWDGVPVWRHCDLLPANILTRDGRLSSVLDFGMAGIGDPALDAIPAWAAFDQTGRPVFRQALEVDDGTWDRARGFALHQALLIIPYYRVTNPAFVRLAERTVREVLADLGF